MDINKKYTFNTLAPALLGAVYKNVRLISISAYENVLGLINVDLKHQQIYPLLPSGTPNNPKNYTYYLFRTEQDTDVVLANVWIDQSSITEVTQIRCDITIPSIASGQEIVIRNALLQLGITNATISVS